MPLQKSDEGHVQPGDLLEMVIQLRKMMGDLDTKGYLVETSFERYGLEVEAAAVAARPAILKAANTLQALLEALEHTPEYRRQKDVHDSPRSARTTQARSVSQVPHRLERGATRRLPSDE